MLCLTRSYPSASTEWAYGICGRTYLYRYAHSRLSGGWAVLALPTLNHETSLAQMTDEPNLIPALRELIESQIEPPEIVEGG